MTLKALLPQYPASNEAVTDVMLLTITKDARRMTPANADVMQHGSFFNELRLNRQFLMLFTYQQATVGHLSAMP
jgi:hypothetical protein